jgi:hypothetical protein
MRIAYYLLAMSCVWLATIVPRVLKCGIIVPAPASEWKWLLICEYGPCAVLLFTAVTLILASHGRKKMGKHDKFWIPFIVTAICHGCLVWATSAFLDTDSVTGEIISVPLTLPLTVLAYWLAETGYGDSLSWLPLTIPFAVNSLVYGAILWCPIYLSRKSRVKKELQI